MIATGITHSIQELVDAAFEAVGLRAKDYVVTDPKFLRPAEVDFLVGNSEKAKKKLGWSPRVSFEQLIRMMVNEDLRLLQRR